MQLLCWYLSRFDQKSSLFSIRCETVKTTSLRFSKMYSRTPKLSFDNQKRRQNQRLTFVRSGQLPIATAFYLLAILTAGGAFASILDDRWVEPELIAAPSAMKPQQPVTFQSLGKGYRSGVRAPMQTVIRNQSEWEAIWRQHAAGDSSLRPAPTIDFDKEIVVALFLGDKPTGGYDVRISRAELSNDTLTIHYQERSPAPGGMVVQAWTQPFHMVRMVGEVTNAVVFRRES